MVEADEPSAQVLTVWTPTAQTVNQNLYTVTLQDWRLQTNQSISLQDH